MAEGLSVRVRMGLHTGDPTLVRGTYIGLDVHRAARLCAAAHGGQILLSQTTRDLVQRMLPAELSLRDLGEHHLKDLQRPERIFQLVAAGLPSEFPALRSSDSRLKQPAHANDTAHRARAPARGRTAASSARRRAIALADGPAGVGKTRLGLQIATDLSARFDDGVCSPRWPRSRIRAGRVDDRSRLGSSRGRRSTARNDPQGLPAREASLLVLDNFEQILPAAPVVADLLATAPRLKVLATSRAALHLRAEHELQVFPLGLPELGAGCPRPRSRSIQPSRSSSIARRQSQPGLTFTDDDARGRRGDLQPARRLPLAIELAAARIKLLPPQEMLRRMGRRLAAAGRRAARPAGPTANAPRRDRVELRLLDPTEQKLFRRHSAFVGGCSLQASRGRVRARRSRARLAPVLDTVAIARREEFAALGHAGQRRAAHRDARDHSGIRARAARDAR
jgi:hypothetical protein